MVDVSSDGDFSTERKTSLKHLRGLTRVSRTLEFQVELPDCKALLGLAVSLFHTGRRLKRDMRR